MHIKYAKPVPDGIQLEIEPRISIKRGYSIKTLRNDFCQVHWKINSERWPDINFRTTVCYSGLPSCTSTAVN